MSEDEIKQIGGWVAMALLLVGMIFGPTEDVQALSAVLAVILFFILW